MCVRVVHRYALLTPETYPHWRGTVVEGIKHLMQAVNMEPDQWQLGKTKVFIKSPESVSYTRLIAFHPALFGHVKIAPCPGDE